MTETTQTSALAQLRELERAARDADAEVGLARQEMAQAIAQAAEKRRAVDDFYAAVGCGQREHDEAVLKRLVTTANRAEQPIVKRPTASEPDRVVHLGLEAAVAEARARHNVAVAQVHSFAAAQREAVEAELVEEALSAQRALMSAYEGLRVAVRDHRAAANAFSHLGVLAAGRAPTELPRSAPMPSDIRGQADDIAPPVPTHALTEAVVEAVAAAQPRVAQALARKVADAQERAEWLERRREREAQRDADRPSAA
jgi:hypothetical protein